jgi:hypothetical protein
VFDHLALDVDGEPVSLVRGKVSVPSLGVRVSYFGPIGEGPAAAIVVAAWMGIARGMKRRAVG